MPHKNSKREYSSQKPSKRLVLVVHGIGEQEPGDTLDSLVGAATGNIASVVQSEKRWLRDEHDDVDSRAVDLFACELRRVTTKLSELIFAEVYWADLSRGRTGKLATLYELLKGILGLGHIVRENAEEVHPNGHWLRTLSGWFVAVLHGPIAVLNVLLAAGVLFLSLASLSPDKYVAHLAILVLAIGSTIAGYYVGKRVNSYLFRIFTSWLSWLGLILALVVIATYIFDLNGTITAQNWYGYLLIWTLGLIWLLTLIGVLCMTVAQAIIDPASERSDPKSLYAIICAYMTLLWLIFASSFWASLAKFSEFIPGFRINNDQLQDGTGLMFAVWVSVFVIVVVSICAWIKRIMWAARHNPDNYQTESIARLILNAGLRRAIVFAITLLALVALLIVYRVFKEYDILPAWLPSLPDWLLVLIDKSYLVGLFTAAAAGLLYQVVSSQIAVGLGIAKDVITYFKGEPSAGNSTKQEFPLRARMHRRFVTVMETMIASEKPDEVVVISHSQGTVIAIEAIRGNNIPMLFNTSSIKKRSLVTMGSPYSHIYEHYFPTKFVLPTDFHERLDSWINIFRIDDFVGTIVGDKKGQWPNNIAVNPKGHTGYWRDDEVREILVQNVLPELA